MIDIFVQRGAGDKRGEDIVDPLITAVPVAVQRGRNELDKQAHSARSVGVEAIYRTGVRLGHLGHFLDIQTGLAWRGKISGISHSYQGVEITTSLQVIKPITFV